jgi:hypothetical protein
LPDGLTVVSTTVRVNGWTGRDAKLLKAYFDYWETWPALPVLKALAVCVSIKYAPGRGPDVEALKRAHSFAAYERLRGAILDELASIRIDQAENWARHVDVRPFYHPDREQDLCRDIRLIFNDERQAIPMELIVGRLLDALKSHALE